MTEVKKSQLTIVLDGISRIIPITEEHKVIMIGAYSKYSEQEIVKDLAMRIYQMLGPQSPYYDYALDLVRNYNSSICPTLSEMKSILENIFENKIEGNMSLEQNHELINTELARFCKLFNELGIDYYIVGALPCFIKTGQPLFRYHDDIDIMVNEDDIDKVADILQHTNYEFHDDRFPTLKRYLEMKENEPPHTVLAQNKDNEFHLGFFCFRREMDNSITMREYSHRLEDNNVVVDVLERRSTPKGTSLRYDEVPTQYNGVTFRTSSVESVYNLKGYTKRPKDITDMKKLEPYVDKQKLNALHQHNNQQVSLQNVTKSQTQSANKSLKKEQKMIVNM